MGTKGLNLATVRLIHDFGGPSKVVPIEKRGQTVFVTFGDGLLATLYPVDLKTGYLKSLPKHKIRWRIHPDDFKFWKPEVKQKKRRF